MSLVLNTNISSLNAQNNLTGSQASLSQSLERLSSGLRINSAADDAAGLAISQQFTTQINGTNQAVHNANDAVLGSPGTTAGALNTIVNNLQSIRTLAVESANGSNSASDRAALNNQVQQQIAEITQIAQQTTFNGLNVLNGSSGTTVYQVGANVGNTIAVSLQQGVAANQIGQYATGTGSVTATALTGTNTVSLSDGTSTVSVGPTASFVGSQASAECGFCLRCQGVAAINGAGSSVGLTCQRLDPGHRHQRVLRWAKDLDGELLAPISLPRTPLILSINGVAIYSRAPPNISVCFGRSDRQRGGRADPTQFSAQTGVTASINSSAAAGTVGAIILTAADGSNISVGQLVTAGTGATGVGFAAAVSGTTVAAPVTTRGTVTLTDS